MDDNIYISLLTGEDITFHNIFIHQPSFKEIKEIGIETYNQIMTPYSLTLDYFKENNADYNIDLFTDIFLKDKAIVSCLACSFKILTNAKKVLLYPDRFKLIFEDEKKEIDTQETKAISFVIKILKKIGLFKNYVKKLERASDKLKSNDEKKQEENFFEFTKDNFDEFTEIVLKINASKKMEIERPPKNMSQRQKDVWDKLQEGRKKENKKNEVHLYDILNICEFGGKFHIPISEMMDWSLWKIMNCYKAILNIRTYDDNLKICLVSGKGDSISGNNHWHHQLMIRE